MSKRFKNNEEFERLAQQFYEETGYMAPGKDDPLGHDSREKRREEWEKWLKENDNKNTG